MATFRAIVRETHDGGSIKDTINQAYKYDWDFARNKPPSLEGTKYNRYGTRGEGIGSILDSALVERQIKREKENLGDGFVQLQIVDDGKGNINKPLNIGNRLHYADASGKFTIIDEKFLEIMKQREMEKREYLEGIIQVGVLSDETTAVLLATTVDGLENILGPNTGTAYGIPPMINGQANPLYQVDARPSAIETYAESSQAYSNAIQKYKLVMKAKMPIISELTPQKALIEV